MFLKVYWNRSWETVASLRKIRFEPAVYFNELKLGGSLLIVKITYRTILYGPYIIADNLCIRKFVWMALLIITIQTDLEILKKYWVIKFEVMI